VSTAAVDQTAAVFALLPELLQATSLPPRFIVANVAGDASRLLGAAAFVPQVQNADSPGFLTQCRVLPAFQRLGIGRALLSRLADEARAWDVPHLHAWSAHDDTSEPLGFLRAVGFRPGTAMHHFTLETALMRSASMRFQQGLRSRGRVPADAVPVPLARVPIEPVVALFCAEFGGSPAQARARIERTLAHSMGQELSSALWDGATLAGFFLAGASDTDGSPEVFFRASDRRFRHGWPAAVLLDEFTRAMEAGGHVQARYYCNDRNRATLNLVRRTGARLRCVRIHQVLDLSPTP
jgi:GNAT superfamily N-acetyltransferase